MRATLACTWSGTACLWALSFVLHTAAGAGVAVNDDWTAGKVVVEGDGWRASFAKGAGAVELACGDEAVQITLHGQEGTGAARLETCEILAADPIEGAEIRAVFSAGEKRRAARCRFGRHGTVCITPEEGTTDVAILGAMALGVLPGRRLEDVLYRAEDYADRDEVFVPAENWFSGLLRDGNGIIACAWSGDGQRVNLRLGGDDRERGIQAIEVETDGKEVYVELLAAPGIWHRETPQLGYLEKDVVLDWRPPFEATYKTQLPVRGETTTPRTFPFLWRRHSQIRPEIGYYIWPVWVKDGRAYVHLSKKVPPKGEFVIYPMERGERSLMGFMHRTPLGGLVVERSERAPLPHGPRDAPNVGFVACGGTEILRRSIYALGLQKRERMYLAEHVDLLADYVSIVQQKNASYFVMIERLRAMLEGWRDKERDKPAVAAYLDEMLGQAEATEAGIRLKMELLGENTPEDHVAHAARAAARLKILMKTGHDEVSPECDELVDTLNELSWGHDETMGMRFSMLARAWAQAAARGCAGVPEAAPYAQAIRSAIRDTLNGAPPW